MRFATLIATTLVVFAPASGQATTLADQSARLITAATPKTTSIANRTGSMTRRGIPASFGRGLDPDFRGMVKLAMRFHQSDGSVMTEHCGGAVINSRWIVTAAHCVSPDDGAQWDRIDIVAGDRDLDGPNVIRRTAYQAIIHDRFEYATLTNDIGLLRLQEPLPRTVVPSRLDSAGQPSLKVGQIARAAGWPVTGPKAGAKLLQTTSLAVAAKSLPGFITVQSPSGQAEGVCQGESGGPLISHTNGGSQLSGILSGIAPHTQNSAGEPCMTGGYEMYFTPIAKYRSWIDRVVSLCSHRPMACSASRSVQIASNG